ncbi:TPA: phage tail assembly protein [Serratia odorifera]|uniref:phage tail assembly protein n=1 Tax=Serratia odorifera TaxID=618 RepID=UPI00235FEF8A|nr:phage tail assembly protein [Serratia odorifera]
MNNYPGTTTVITLYSPLTLENGSKLTTVTMREPQVRDRIEFNKSPGSDAEKEAKMIATLCNMNIEDVYSLTAADFSQFEDAVNVFLLPPAKRPKPKSEKP